ncbi:LysR substrate-binding domain-containing protein [Caulobacter sp. NIBR2454]|uniref:LysR substrate-binding domain-containing protein n=1 Tax=Caulobacter sp. NIBR2454 TaxID=3015996 RepID=UPI0022B60CF1|nr:LysR substrate-binding domain-containing protein [Caulobacter sp. NIBR2454]
MLSRVSFNSLCALEAAVRHRSYSRAALELHVTHGAVSQQIRRLEVELEQTLFIRVGNDMQPTPAAEELAKVVAKAAQDLRSGVESARFQASLCPLVISIGPSFARRWLAPRMAELAAIDSALEVRTDDGLANLRSDGVDVAIRFGIGPWPGLESRQIFPDRLAPLCSPDFLARHAINRPEDLAEVPLLRHTGIPWRLWFDAHGLPTPPAANRGVSFDDTSFMLDAAAEGIGVALGRIGFAQADLASGRLVRPLAGEVDIPTAHHFVWRADSPKLARIEVLRDWVLANSQLDR